MNHLRAIWIDLKIWWYTAQLHRYALKIEVVKLRKSLKGAALILLLATPALAADGRQHCDGHPVWDAAHDDFFRGDFIERLDARDWLLAQGCRIHTSGVVSCDAPCGESPDERVVDEGVVDGNQPLPPPAPTVNLTLAAPVQNPLSSECSCERSRVTLERGGHSDVPCTYTGEEPTLWSVDGQGMLVSPTQGSRAVVTFDHAGENRVNWQPDRFCDTVIVDMEPEPSRWPRYGLMAGVGVLGAWVIIEALDDPEPEPGF